MAFTRWDPLQDLLTLRNEFGRLVGSDASGWIPSVDLYETSAAFVLEAELPGLTRDQIDIHAEEHLIVISGHRDSRDTGGPRQPTSGEQYHRIERGHGHFSRAFTLPEPIDVAAVSAELRAGILVLTLPKTSGHAARRINVT